MFNGSIYFFLECSIVYNGKYVGMIMKIYSVLFSVIHVNDMIAIGFI